MRWGWMLLLLVACGGDKAEPGSSDGSSNGPATDAVDRDVWWTAATKTALGAERVLAPRELRALMQEGRTRGFDADAEWWKPKSKWAYQSVLSLDPEDVEANAAVGRKTIQSLPGFAAFWGRLLAADVFNEPMNELTEQYGDWVAEQRPVFLDEGEVQVVLSKMRQATTHLDKMDSDPAYAALQKALERVPSQLRGYPSVRAQVGPFLVFFAARDLQRIEGEDEAAEEERRRVLRQKYEKDLAARVTVLEELLADLKKTHPAIAERYALQPKDYFFLWIFGDPEWYGDFTEKVVRGRPESRYRCGFLQQRDMWGYFFLPREMEAAGDEDGEVVADLVDPEQQLRESLAFVAAQQLLRHWGRDPEDRFANRLDRSRAYWIKEGWPAYLAARRVEKPMVGPALEEGWRFGREPPTLRTIVQQESRLALQRFQEAPPEQVEGAEPVLALGLRDHFADLSWLLTKQLNEEPKRRRAFEAFLISQIEATASGNADGFAKAFALKDESDWIALEDVMYRPLDEQR